MPRHRCHDIIVTAAYHSSFAHMSNSAQVTVLKWQRLNDSAQGTVTERHCSSNGRPAMHMNLARQFHTCLPNLSHSHFNNPNRNVYMEMCILHDFYIWYESTTLASFELESFTRSATASTCCCLCCSWLQEHIMPHEIEPVPSFPCALPLLCHR